MVAETPAPAPRYRTLDPQRIVETIDALSGRIAERFPGAGLYDVSRRLREIAVQARGRAESIARPIWAFRVAAAVLAVLVVGGTAGLAALMRLPGERISWPDLIQLLEAGINDVVLIGAAVFFLATMEIRIRRRRALAAIHEIRSVAHIIDMHQLTKDPERLHPVYRATVLSPAAALGRFELERYLDYCSELLSLAAKVAAVYVQEFDDPVALASANQVEALCAGLGHKIWQKINILQILPDPPCGGAGGLVMAS